MFVRNAKLKNNNKYKSNNTVRVEFHCPRCIDITAIRVNYEIIIFPIGIVFTSINNIRTFLPRLDRHGNTYLPTGGGRTNLSWMIFFFFFDFILTTTIIYIIVELKLFVNIINIENIYANRNRSRFHVPSRPASIW